MSKKEDREKREEAGEYLFFTLFIENGKNYRPAWRSWVYGGARNPLHLPPPEDEEQEGAGDATA